MIYYSEGHGVNLALKHTHTHTHTHTHKIKKWFVSFSDFSGFETSPVLDGFFMQEEI